MKNVSKIAALLAAVLMILCVTGCGDTAGGTPATPAGGGNSTPTPAAPTMQETPLTLEAVAAGTITLTHPWSTLKYKKNGGDFVNVTASANTISLAAGDKIAFYADGSANGNVFKLKIGCSADCYVYGNVMSLLSSTNFKTAVAIPNTTGYTFAELFSGNTHIKNHATKNLVLPATTLANSCYSDMFFGCTGLTSAPALPATTLAESCYDCMFSGCTGLTSAPELPARTLARSCYIDMFHGCTGLTGAPALPAESLAQFCYYKMFNGCTGLTSGPALPATTLAASCYSYMFYGCTGLTSAPALLATPLANSCYSEMFHGCTGLTSAPALPAESLANSCYSNMFYGCTGLTSAPEVLPATILANYCYDSMFEGCTSLTSAPALPAESLADYCYNDMFYDCTRLSSVTCLATDISAESCTFRWLSNVASGGTFTKASSMSSWETVAYGIPSGWTVVDAQ